MTDQPQDDHTEMNRIQLESARVDLALKNRELAEKTGRWRIFKNQAFVVGFAAALASGIFGFITASFQAHADREKSAQQLNTTLVLNAFTPLTRDVIFLK
jgi:hypothetical protein